MDGSTWWSDDSWLKIRGLLVKITLDFELKFSVNIANTGIGKGHIGVIVNHNLFFNENGQ